MKSYSTLSYVLSLLRRYMLQLPYAQTHQNHIPSRKHFFQSNRLHRPLLLRLANSKLHCKIHHEYRCRLK